MTDTFATRADLVARVSSTYTVPEDPEATRMLTRASELIDDYTRSGAQELWDSDDDTLKDELTKATCDQVEFWLEVGEEHDVTGLYGALMAGRFQVQKLPGRLGPRARATLLRAGLLWGGVGSF